MRKKLEACPLVAQEAVATQGRPTIDAARILGTYIYIGVTDIAIMGGRLVEPERVKARPKAKRANSGVRSAKE